MTPVQFENKVLATITPLLDKGNSAEFFEGSLFVEGINRKVADKITQALNPIHNNVIVTGGFLGYSFDFAE